MIGEVGGVPGGILQGMHPEFRSVGQLAFLGVRQMRKDREPLDSRGRPSALRRARSATTPPRSLQGIPERQGRAAGPSEHEHRGQQSEQRRHGAIPRPFLQLRQRASQVLVTEQEGVIPVKRMSESLGV